MFTIKIKRTILFVLCCALLGSSGNLLAALSQDPSLQWQTLTTEHFEIHFHDGEEALAKEVGDISESVHTRLARKFNWTPRERTQVVLTDRFDYANGSATPMPRNTMHLLVSPPTGNSVISDHDNWLELLIVHEYTHILHLDKASGLPDNLRNVFGRNLFLFPNLLQPPWLIEGLATYEETDNARSIGRGQGTLFRGLMRQEVVNGVKPLNQVNQPLVSWPLNTARYLYGVYFFQFLADRPAQNGSEEKIIELVEQYSNNLLPFAINSNSEQVYSKDMLALWDEFSDELRNAFLPEIERIKESGERTGTQMTHSGYYTRAPLISDQGDIYYLENDLQSEPRLMVFRKGKTKPETVADARGSSFDFHPTAGIVGAEIDAFNNTNQFSDLYHLDPASGKKTALTTGKRYLHASWSPDGKEIIAVHNQLGQHALHRLDANGNNIETLWQGEDKTVISSMDWSPDGQSLVMSVWRPETLWNLELFDIHTRQWTPLTHDTAIENSPRYSSDGQSIVFSADYDGVFNIYRLALNSEHAEKLTNVIGEATSPAIHISSTEQQLVYIGLGANGYDLFRLDIASAKTGDTLVALAADKESSSTSPSGAQTSVHTKKNDALSKSEIEPYNALSRISPTSWFPYFQFDNEHSEIGLTTFGADPLRRHFYNALLAYDTDNQWLVGQLNYIYDRWNPTLKFSLDREILVYLDNAGDVERYRNSDTFSVEAVWPFFRYQRQWLLHAGLVSESESDKKVVSNAGSVPTFYERLAGLAISFNSARRYARSISPSDGRQVWLVAEDNELLDSDYTGQVYTLDWRELIGLPERHVLSTRAVLGWGTDNPRDFRLGGTQEDSVPATPQTAATALTQDIFDHRRYPLHGYPEGRADLRGRRMTLLELEWRFPIRLVERGLMAPPVGLHQIHGKLLYNWGESWDQGDHIPALRRGAGIEFTAEMTLGYWLPMNVRFGYANGFDLGGEKQTYIEAGVPF